MPPLILGKLAEAVERIPDLPSVAIAGPFLKRQRSVVVGVRRLPVAPPARELAKIVECRRRAGDVADAFPFRERPLQEVRGFARLTLVHPNDPEIAQRPCTATVGERQVPRLLKRGPVEYFAVRITPLPEGP